jgi:hypothetical protein
MHKLLISLILLCAAHAQVYDPFLGRIVLKQSTSGAGTGTVTSVTIAGTSRKVSVSGGCSITVSGTCTLTLPSDLLLPLNTAFTAGTTAGPSFNLPSGVAPTSPASGDFWNLSGVLQFYDGSNTLSLLNINGAGTSGGIPYFGAGTRTLSSSAVWTANTLMKGGGPAASPIVTAITVDASNNVSGMANLSISGGLSTGASPPTVTGNGVIALSESTGQTCAVAGVDCLTADSSSHRLQLSNNNAAASNILTAASTDTVINKSIVATQLTGTLQAAQFPALTGDVTTSAGAVATTIANSAVTNAKIANSTIDLTAKVTGLLPVANGGSGVGTLTGIPKYAGTSAITAATAGTDYSAPATTETTSGGRTFTGVVDASGASRTAPAKSGTSIPGTCTVGDVFFKTDATAGQNLYYCTSTNSFTQQLNSGAGGATAGASLFSTTASTTVTATSATTLIGAVTGSVTVPANTFTAGQPLQIVAQGYYSTPATPVSLTIDILIGGTARLTTGAVVQIASVTNGVWNIFCTITTRTAGASGTQIGNCIFVGTGSTLTPGEAPLFTSSTWTMDTTATKVIDLQATWSTATGSPTITATNVYALIPGAPVSSFSGDGALLSNSSSTGAITATLATAAAHKAWMNNTGSTATPGYQSIGTADLPAALANQTSINGLNITASTGTLTVASGKTASVSNTLTFTGTDSSSVAFGGGGTVTYTLASGTATLGTSAISANSCATVVTPSASSGSLTGIATTDVINWTPNADWSAITGYGKASTDGLIVYVYATTNTVNFKVCNATGSSLTPGAATANWVVRR